MYRHTDYLRSDGSLSIHEMVRASNYTRKFNRLKHLVTEGKHPVGPKVPESQTPKEFDQKKYPAHGIQSYVGFVNTVLFNEKGRFEIGFCENWSEGELPQTYTLTPAPLARR